MKAAVLAVALLASCVLTTEARDLLQTEAPAAAPCQSIAATAAAAGLTTLVQAVEAAGLTSVVSDPTANLTVFAPTNDAFTAALAALGVPNLDLATLQSQGLLQPTLLNHVVTGAYTAEELNEIGTVPSLFDQDLTIDGTTVSTASGNPANIIMADVPACESVVHVIDAVLVPQLTGLGSRR